MCFLRIFTNKLLLFRSFENKVHFYSLIWKITLKCVNTGTIKVSNKDVNVFTCTWLYILKWFLKLKYARTALQYKFFHATVKLPFLWKIEGYPYKSSISPDLPDERVNDDPPFTHTGLDFADLFTFHLVLRVRKKWLWILKHEMMIVGVRHMFV